ncbi:BofC C-terminal domain-containing protein [Cohnella boryungensis]|uniref:BofC C-terminal domain-containing protein n=1 Tax=Cohnella boryungensis TaxID=768479 RepID=A0ABV8SF23_9BACL
MSRFRIFKELKKSLKRKRRHVWSLGIGAFVFLAASLAGAWLAHRVVSPVQSEIFAPEESAPVWMDKLSDSDTLLSRSQALLALRNRKGDVELVLQRTYLCGEETRRLGTHTASKAEELLRSHREWDARFESGRLTVKENVDDLSPRCRQSAYVGMDKSGNLSLYDGPPWKDKVIRTFFHLDVERMEAQLGEERARELAAGIRVPDKAAYSSMLSAFNEYASVSSQAKPQP